jgi:amidohydrolase
MTHSNSKDAARARFSGFAADLMQVSRQIHGNPELAYEEERASGWLCRILERAGMEVERGVAGVPTAFVARAGTGRLQVAICAEYDALPGIGHACGHNLIGASSAGAGIALSRIADDLDMTVRVIGTPAEEVGDAGGKIVLLERGVFDGVHAALMAHPGPVDVTMPPMLACATFDVHYRGLEAHASAFPELGVNAADALTVAQTAIGLLRQQMGRNDRVHGIVTKGGDAPNIIPAHTSARYIVRAPTFGDLDKIKQKVWRCFEAGALASGAELELRGGDKPYAHMAHDRELAGLYQANCEILGRRFRDFGRALERSAASTDMGNVSLACPSIHPIVGIESNGSVPHQPEFARHCVGPSSERALADASLALAWSAIDLATNPELRARYQR